MNDRMQSAVLRYQAGDDEEVEQLLGPLGLPSPTDAAANHLLGLVRLRQGRLSEAHELLLAAVCVAPAIAEFHNSLGTMLATRKEFGPAQVAFQQAIRLKPRYPEAIKNLAEARLLQGSVVDAAFHYDTALRLDPKDAEALRQRLTIARALSDLPTVLRCLVALVDLFPENADLHAELLVAKLHHHGNDGPRVYQEHREWADQHAPAHVVQSKLERSLVSGRKLRIGYIGPAFRRYTAARFAKPLIESHDRNRVETFLYCDVPEFRWDATTRAFQQFASGWRPIAGLTDLTVQRLMLDDQLDVLVDLAGHMDSRRMRLMASRNAPIQINYLAYPATSGLDTVDFRVTDSVCDPPGIGEGWHSEQLLRLDPCCWCYTLVTDGDEVLPQPQSDSWSGPIRFGAFNRLLKVTAPMLESWRQILERAADSTLAVIAAHPSAIATIRERFVTAGISADQVIVHPPSGRHEFLKLFDSIDLLLDTVPYSGMTTTCDALYRGVPVLTQAGTTHVSRVGSSLLCAVGLEDFVVGGSQEYVEGAVRLANEPERLRRTRSELPARVAQSSLSRGKQLAEQFESALVALLQRG